MNQRFPIYRVVEVTARSLTCEKACNSMKSLLDYSEFGTKLLQFCQKIIKNGNFLGFFMIWRIGILYLPLHRTCGDTSLFVLKNGEVLPYPIKLGSLFGLLAISCQKKAANQRGKGFLSDYRLYLRNCSWGRKKSIHPWGRGRRI